MSTLLYSEPNITHSELNLLPTPEALGRFHHPYPFGRYVSDIKNSLDNHGLIVANEEFEIAAEGQRLFGVLEVQPREGTLITADDWKLLIGLRGSHDQSIQRSVSAGSQVLVCSNLCFSGSLGALNTKQTTNIEYRLPNLIEEVLARVPEIAQKQEQSYEAYKEFEITPRQGDAALVELHRRGAFSGSQLARAISEWDEPSYEEHTVYDAGTNHRSGWRLFNASTQALKPTGANHNPNILQDRTEKVSAFLQECVGL